jgi:pimeloyl-ACP methyl ester carboxylesterase
MNKIKIMVLILILIFPIIEITQNLVQEVQAVDSNTFSIMQISDTQFLPLSSPQLFKDTSNWIVNNAINYNLKMVIHTGDIVDNINASTGTSSDPLQWEIANSSMSSLLNANIPYCWDAGNHDQIPWNNASGTWLGSSYASFNASNMRSKTFWVSDFQDSKNTAVRFTFKGYDFLIINIEYMANNTTISWMKNLLDNYKNSNIIIAAHTYLNKGGTYGFSSPGLPGEVAWCNNFKAILGGYQNIFLTLNGHDPTGTANMSRVGNREEIFFNRQSATTTAGQTGAAAVRIYTFDLTNMQVNSSTYSLDTQTWLTTSTNQFTFNIALNRNDWVLVNDAKAVKGYSDLREYEWQKNATMAPNGPYDKIGLHRLAKVGLNPKGVVFVLPGVYGSGQSLISNPPSSSFTITENMSQCYYWANRGYDVYSIDYRRHFIPADMNSSQLTFITDWGLEQMMNDIKEAVDKSKEVSGTAKVFLAGMSMGGSWAQYYAARYWQQDLRGIILLDPASKSTMSKSSTLTNTYNVTENVERMKIYGNWSWENPQQTYTPSPLNPGYLSLIQYAFQNPTAPAKWPNGTSLTPLINPRTNTTWANIAEWVEYGANSGKASNSYGGYGNNTVTMYFVSQGERYINVRPFIDSGALLDWDISPYISFDFMANIKKINVPVIGFRSGLLGIPSYGNLTNGMATTDFTSITLPNYGHGDVYNGVYCARDVSEPTYQWMINHYSGLSALASPLTLTVLTGQTGIFSVNASGTVAPYTYQWYQGSNLLTGQTKPQLSLPTTKSNEGGSYPYYCIVTDAEGKTINSNAVTLTVQAPAFTSTSTPTENPSPTITPITPTPTVNPTQTVAPTPKASTSEIGQSQNIPIEVYIATGLIIAVCVTVLIIFVIKKNSKTT